MPLHVTVLGSGTLVPDDRRRSAGHLVECRGGEGGGEAAGPVLLLDCGPGVIHGMTRFGLEPGIVTAVALSHFHADHFGDLPHLLFHLVHGLSVPRTHPLEILGPVGLRRRMEALRDAFGGFILDPPFPLEVTELPGEGEWVAHGGRMRLRAFPTGHTPEAVGYRVEGDGGTVGYTGDTGPNAGLAAFLAGVDLLLAECALPDPPSLENHLTPAGVAAMAEISSPSLLLLTHLYPSLDRREVVALVRAAGYSGPVEVAEDGWTGLIPSSPLMKPPNGPATGG